MKEYLLMKNNEADLYTPNLSSGKIQAVLIGNKDPQCLADEHNCCGNFK